MKMILSLLCTFFLQGSAVANGMDQATVLNSQVGLNRASPNAMAKYRLGSLVIKGTAHVAKGQYNFATQGGAISAINLKDEFGQNLKIPKNGIVRNCLIDIITAPTSGGSATIAFGTGQTAVDLKAATAIASLTGLVACLPVGTAATSIKLTADRSPIITIATAALTAGKFNVLIEYDVSDPQ